MATHNTWMRTGQESMVGLNVSEDDGSISCAGRLDIRDYALHDQNMLVFKLVYRGKLPKLLTLFMQFSSLSRTLAKAEAPTPDRRNLYSLGGSISLMLQAGGISWSLRSS